jgi:hypothetical protein
VASFSSITDALKVVYPWKEMMRDWYETQPCLNWMPKRTDFYGSEQRLTISHGPGGGVSHDFNDAQAAEDQENAYGMFTITRAKSYGLIYLDGEAIEAAEGKGAAYLSTKKDHIKAVMTRLAMQSGYEVFGDGTGEAGIVSAIAGPGASAVITLTIPDQIVRFEKGMRLTAASAAGGTTRGGTPGYVTVTAVDRELGKITVDDSTYITGLTAGDYLAPKGNRNAAVKGFKSYLSNSATPGTLWGLNRNVDKTRLAGIYYDGSASSPTEGIQRGLTLAARERTYPGVVWVNHTQYLNIELDLGSKAQREAVKIGEWGYDSLRVTCGGRRARIMADPNIDTADGWGLTQNTWCFHTLKKMPRYLTYGAGKDIVKPTNDGIELRLGWKGQQICRAPGKNLRLLLST